MTNSHQGNPPKANYEVAAGELLSSMIDLYPSFKIESPAAIKNIWAAHLSEFSPEAIRKAASRMIDKHPTFAPTIGEFKQLCRATGESRRPEHKMLPHRTYPKAAAEIANRELTKMRGVLGTNNLTEVPRETDHPDIS